MKHFSNTRWQFPILLVLGFCFAIIAHAQQITVNGLVRDAQGQPVMFANVVQKGTGNGTNTNLEGRFTLTVPAGATLVVSYVGYKTAEATARQGMVITMEDNDAVLSEAVVIGYGTVKKGDATGSVVAIKPEEMNKGLTTNAQDMLQGKMPGVNIISDGGTPGGNATIRIRGGSSLNASNDPLIVIDGLPMDNNGVKGLSNPLSMINPNDIETFTVLKDASAAAIYGSRGANGVIIITTKKGKLGSRPRITYSGSVSMSTLPSKLDLLDGDEYRALIGEKFGTSSTAYSALGSANTDWQDEIYRSPVSTDHNITVSGGYKNVPYRVSIGYTNNQGIIKTSKFERYTASLSLTPSFFDNHLKVNANLKGMIAKSRYADGTAIGAAASMDPTQSVYYSGSDAAAYNTSFGGFFQWSQPVVTTSGGVTTNALNDNTWTIYKNSLAPSNPLSVLELKNDRSTAKSLVGNLELEYKLHFLPEVTLHMNGGMDLSTGRQNTDVLPTSPLNNYYGSFGYEEIDKYNLLFNAYAQYAKEFTDYLRFDAMAGYEWQHFHRKGNNFYTGYYPSTNTLYPGQQYQPSSDEWLNESYLVSFFGRANVALYDRYLFTATVRRDGSSRVSPHWGTFPSFALGWKLSEEAFLKNVKWLSDLKLRLGYGQTGQQAVDNDYAYAATYTYNKTGAYYLGNTLRPNAYTPDLKWERTTTYNVGLDAGFLKNRITMSFDYYYRKTNDLINYVYVPAQSNFNSQANRNVGSLKNFGLEYSINGIAIEKKDFSWELGYNIAWNKNEITKLTANTQEGYYVATGGISGGTGNTVQAHAVGHAASSFFVYQQVYDDNGKPIQNLYVDRNGDGIINDNDRYFYKKPTADVTMGFSSKWLYKNWDLGFTLRASLGNYVYNDVLAAGSDMANNSIFYQDAYFVNRLSDAVALGFMNNTADTYLSDYFVQNASFLKMDNITLGYSFSKIGRYNVGGRISFAVQNVFTITGYDGLDPEVSTGIDNNLYPRPRVFVLGLNLNF